jgi:hypothetical protein
MVSTPRRRALARGRGARPLLDHGRERHHREQLRCQEHLVAPAADGLAHDPLRAAVGVDLGRVDEVDAEIERPVHDGVRLRAGVVLAVPPVARAELPAAEPDHGDAGTFHLHEAHPVMLPHRGAGHTGVVG